MSRHSLSASQADDNEGDRPRTASDSRLIQSRIVRLFSCFHRPIPKAPERSSLSQGIDRQIQPRPQYTPLDATKQEIRLMKISPGKFKDELKCTLSVVQLDEVEDKYETISYCWGASTRFKEAIIDGNRCCITASSYTVLRYMRLRCRSRVVWIDAVCINQTSNAEKSHQVGLMASIYSCGSRNLVWLGEDTGMATRSAKAIQLMYDEMRVATKNFSRFEATVRNPKTGVSLLSDTDFEYDHDFESITALFELDWFRRLWVVQEIFLAKSDVVYWGRTKMPLRQILYASKWLDHKWNFIPKYIHHCEALKSVLNMYELWDQREKKHALAYLLCLAVKFEKTEKRDGVYGVLAMRNGQGLQESYENLLAVDYDKPFPEILSKAMRYALLDHGDLKSLSYVNHPNDELVPELMSGVTTWSMRLDIPDPDPENSLPFELFRANQGLETPGLLGDMSCGADVLLLKGFVFDRIKSTTITCKEAIFYDAIEFTAWLRHLNHCCQGKVLSEDIALALVAGCGRNGESIDEVELGKLVGFLERLEQTRDESLQNRNDDQRRDEIESLSKAHDMKPCLGRRFSATYARRAALVPRCAQAKDIIAIMEGGQLPLVLREAENGYHFVGTAYVHGIMNGEAVGKWRRDGGTLTTFAVR